MLFKYCMLRIFFAFLIFWKWNLVKGQSFESCHFTTEANFVVCDCSNLGLTEITEPLEAGVAVLILRNNSLQTISADVFQNVNELIELDLSQNGLISIQENTFSNLRTLRRLNLSNNRIISLDSSSLRNLQQLKILALNDNRLSAIPSLNDLQGLQDLRLQGNSLDIDATDFQGLRKLRYLDLSRNQIRTIEIQVFANMNDLVHLNLSYNWISMLHRATFERQVSLEYLDLAQNDIHTFNLTIFDGLITPKIKVLNLTDNNLNSLPSEFFARLGALTDLQVADNNIQAWEKPFFLHASNLEVLNLASNAIANLEERIFSRQQKLRVLNLSKNRLKDGKRSLLDIYNLEILHLGFNNIKKLPTNLLSAPLQLKEIILSGNLFNSTPAFTSYSNLELIRLDRNSISRVFEGDFDKLRMLTKLDLSSNYIQEVEVNAFDQAISLISINLSANKLKTLPANLFTNLQQLMTLDLRMNPWHCDCALFDFLQSFPNMLELFASSEVTCQTPLDFSGQPIEGSAFCTDRLTGMNQLATKTHIVAISAVVAVFAVSVFMIFLVCYWIKHKDEKYPLGFSVPSHAEQPTANLTRTLPLPPNSEAQDVQSDAYYLSVDDRANQYETIDRRMRNPEMLQNNQANFGTDGYLSPTEIRPSPYAPMSNIYLEPKMVKAQEETNKLYTMTNTTPDIEENYLM